MMIEESGYRIKLGRMGEDLAAEYLKDHHYTIIARNMQVGHSDIDILAKDGKTLVFTEVRTKTHRDKGSPEESITKKKLRQMTKTAELYMFLKKYNGPARLDAICIVIRNLCVIEYFMHYQNIS